jgi:hypothetical protein
MKLLWETHDDHTFPSSRIELLIHWDGNYYIRSYVGGTEMCCIPLPPAKGDELRVALIPGFDPLRDDPNQIAADQEPPHLDD